MLQVEREEGAVASQARVAAGGVGDARGYERLLAAEIIHKRVHVCTMHQSRKILGHHGRVDVAVGLVHEMWHHHMRTRLWVLVDVRDIFESRLVCQQRQCVVVVWGGSVLVVKHDKKLVRSVVTNPHPNTPGARCFLRDSHCVFLRGGELEDVANDHGDRLALVGALWPRPAGHIVHFLAEPDVLREAGDRTYKGRE